MPASDTSSAASGPVGAVAGAVVSGVAAAPAFSLIGEKFQFPDRTAWRARLAIGDLRCVYLDAAQLRSLAVEALVMANAFDGREPK